MEWRLFADVAERADERRVSLDLETNPTVREALEALFDVHPELRDRVLDGDELAAHLTILVDGEPLGDAGLEERVDPGAELALFPPVSGG
ncbi:MAG: ubiquitin-like small modifier protein 1 [Halobacteriaceae archaeon]